MTRRLSMRELAEQAGVSATTVSRVFRGEGYVGEETRQRILRLAKETGFKPRAYRKRAALTAHDAVIGVVVPDLSNAFFQQIIRAMTNVFDQHGVEVLLCDTNESPSKEIRSLSMLRDLHINGLIVAPTSENASYNTAFLKELNEKGTAIVLLDRDIKGAGLCGVFQNSYDGAFNAVCKLIEMGHKCIATVGGPITSKPGLDRMVGYMDALKTHDMEVRQEFILYGDFKVESGYELTERLLREHPEVTAIFAANNLMSVGSLRAIRNAKMRVPDDIAFISYGSLTPYTIHRNDNISELIEPTELMGRECAMLMLEKMSVSKRKGSNMVKRVSFDTVLRLKGSEAYVQTER